MDPNDECYCDFKSRRFFGSKETAHDPLCPQYSNPKALLKRARQFIADSGCDEDDSDVNLERNKLLAEIDVALS